MPKFLSCKYLKYLKFSSLQICPEHEQYKLYYAQTLQKSCQYEAAMKASFTVDSPALKDKVVKLQVCSNDIIENENSDDVLNICLDDQLYVFANIPLTECVC